MAEKRIMPGPEKENLRLLGVLMTYYATARTSEDKVKVRLGVAAVALQDVPSWALNATLAAWWRGDLGDNTFEPGLSVLRAHAVGMVAEVQWKILRAKRLLAAQPVEVLETTPEHRAKMLKKLSHVVGTGRGES